MGSATPADLSELADRIAAARGDGRTLAPITGERTLTMEQAYAVQRAGFERRLARGEQLVGWKLGYTSAAMREQMGVEQPNFGPLTDVMLLDSGDAVSTELLQPRVEPEIALRFARDLDSPTSRRDVLAAVEAAVACLEVVDSVWTDYRFSIEDNTADGSSAAQVVLGPRLPDSDLDAVSVELRRNGETVGHGSGADASGHPAEGVLWLAEQLAARGDRVRAGQVVITGGLTRAVALAPGDTIDASYDGSTSVSVRRLR